MNLFLLALALLLQATNAQPAQDTASLEGFVQKLGTTDPIARARVVLNGDGGPASSLSATTDGSGKFIIQNIQPGRYRLFVTRDGYVRAEYGQRGPGLTGIPITLGVKQELKDVRIPMTPTGAIAGRIYDRYGDPVVNATVQALKYTYQDGRRVLTVAQSGRSNDLGDYRLFWMQPGQYIVSAVPNQTRFDADAIALNLGSGGPVQIGGIGSEFVGRIAATAMGVGPPGDTDETHLTVYYPGSTDAASASPIDLRPGANYTGVDLTVVDTRAVKIRGRVISNRTGGASVSLIPRGTLIGGISTQRTAQVTDQGTFEFRGIAPGSYDLIATSGRQVISFSTESSGGQTTVTRNAFIVAGPVGAPGEAGKLFQPNMGEPRLFGRVSIDVGSSDVDNVTIQLQPGVTIQGRISIEGPGAGNNDPTITNMRVFLRPDPMIPQLSAVPTSVAANGTFTVTDVAPGDYRLSVSSLPRGGYVKSAALGGSDASNLLLRIDGEPRGALEISIGTNPGSLDALAQNEKQEAAAGVTVVLVPTGAARLRPELFRSVTSDASGRVHLDFVVPGDYKLFAWENVENGAWQDPDFMRIYEERGKPVRISEGGRELAEVRVIPYR